MDLVDDGDIGICTKYVCIGPVCVAVCLDWTDTYVATRDTRVM